MVTYPRSDAPNQAQCVTADELVRSSLPGRCRRSGRSASKSSSLAHVHITILAGSVGHSQTKTRRRTLRSADGPVLAQLLGKILAGSSPVGADVLAQVLNVSLKVELILLEPADIELLPGSAALELTGNILLVIAHDSEQHVSIMCAAVWATNRRRQLTW